MSDDYKVGYRKPPKHSRFKPGQSGNPRGRPRESKNLATLVDQVLHQRVTVREGGKSRRMTKWELIIHSLVNKAIRGDARAAQAAFALARQMGQFDKPNENQPQGGVLLLPAPRSAEEWEKAVAEQQRPYRARLFLIY